MKLTAVYTFLGAFLILIGLAGYLNNPEKAKTALISGGTFGLVFLGLAAAAWKGWKGARVTGLGVLGVLIPVFLWRGTVSWKAVAEGEPKLVAAGLISAMLVASLLTGWLVLKQRPPQASSE